MFKTRLLNVSYKSLNKALKRNCYSAISDIFSQKQVDDQIVVKGWVKSLRKQKENVFIDINDGSCNNRLQVFISAKEKPSNLTTGSSIIASGKLAKTPKGQLELIANNINITGECVISDGYPFAPRKIYPPEYIRQYLHLRPRTNKFSSLLRIRDTATKAINDYFHEEGYFQIHTPILTSNDCEGAGEVFSVQPEKKAILKDMLKNGVSEEEAYFNTKAFLTVSGQLHLEAVAHGLSKVYTFGPTFRAENSKSRLHLSEFYMVEAETAFVENLEDVMGTIEKLLKQVTKTIVDKHSNEMQQLNELENNFNLNWVDKPFIVLEYDEALGILEKNRGKLSSGVDKEEGLSKEHELFLVTHCGGALTFVINWPKNMKPFYMKECSHDPTKVNFISGGSRVNAPYVYFEST